MKSFIPSSRFLKKCLKWVITWQTLPNFSWIKAAEHYSEGAYQKAERLYEIGLEKNPKHPARFCAMMDLSYCYFKAKKFQSAIEQLNNVIKNLPNSKEAYLRLAYVYIWIGNDSEAVWLLRNALKKFPRDLHLVHLFVASVIESNAPKHIVQEARDLLDALTTLPKSYKLAVTISKAMLDHSFEKDAKSFKTLVKLSVKPGSPLSSKLIVAKEYIEQGNYEVARVHLNQALKIAPEFPQTLSLLAETYFQERFDDEEKLDYALQLSTQAAQNSAWLSPRELHTLAQIYHKFGDKTSALLLASKAQDINQSRSDAYTYSNQLDEFINSLSSGTLN